MQDRIMVFGNNGYRKFLERYCKKGIKLHAEIFFYDVVIDKELDFNSEFNINIIKSTIKKGIGICNKKQGSIIIRNCSFEGIELNSNKNVQKTIISSKNISLVNCKFNNKVFLKLVADETIKFTKNNLANVEKGTLIELNSNKKIELKKVTEVKSNHLKVKSAKNIDIYNSKIITSTDYMMANRVRLYNSKLRVIDVTNNNSIRKVVLHNSSLVNNKSSFYIVEGYKNSKYIQKDCVKLPQYLCLDNSKAILEYRATLGYIREIVANNSFILLKDMFISSHRLLLENTTIQVGSPFNNDITAFRVPNEIEKLMLSSIEKGNSSARIYNQAFNYSYIDESYQNADRIAVDKANIVLCKKKPYYKD